MFKEAVASIHWPIRRRINSEQLKNNDSLSINFMMKDLSKFRIGIMTLNTMPWLASVRIPKIIINQRNNNLSWNQLISKLSNLHQWVTSNPFPLRTSPLIHWKPERKHSYWLFNRLSPVFSQHLSIKINKQPWMILY